MAEILPSPHTWASHSPRSPSPSPSHLSSRSSDHAPLTPLCITTVGYNDLASCIDRLLGPATPAHNYGDNSTHHGSNTHRSAGDQTHRSSDSWPVKGGGLTSRSGETVGLDGVARGGASLLAERREWDLASLELWHRTMLALLAAVRGVQRGADLYSNNTDRNRYLLEKFQADTSSSPTLAAWYLSHSSWHYPSALLSWHHDMHQLLLHRARAPLPHPPLPITSYCQQRRQEHLDSIRTKAAEAEKIAYIASHPTAQPGVIDAMGQHHRRVKFQALTQLDAGAANRYLAAGGWDVRRAMDAYLVEAAVRQVVPSLADSVVGMHRDAVLWRKMAARKMVEVSVQATSPTQANGGNGWPHACLAALNLQGRRQSPTSMLSPTASVTSEQRFAEHMKEAYQPDTPSSTSSLGDSHMDAPTTQLSFQSDRESLLAAARMESFPCSELEAPVSPHPDPLLMSPAEGLGLIPAHPVLDSEVHAVGLPFVSFRSHAGWGEGMAVSATGPKLLDAMSPAPLAAPHHSLGSIDSIQSVPQGPSHPWGAPRPSALATTVPSLSDAGPVAGGPPPMVAVTSAANPKREWHRTGAFTEYISDTEAGADQAATAAFAVALQEDTAPNGELPGISLPRGTPAHSPDPGQTSPALTAAAVPTPPVALQAVATHAADVPVAIAELSHAPPSPGSPASPLPTPFPMVHSEKSSDSHRFSPLSSLTGSSHSSHSARSHPFAPVDSLPYSITHSPFTSPSGALPSYATAERGSQVDSPVSTPMSTIDPQQHSLPLSRSSDSIAASHLGGLSQVINAPMAGVTHSHPDAKEENDAQTSNVIHTHCLTDNGLLEEEDSYPLSSANSNGGSVPEEHLEPPTLKIWTKSPGAQEAARAAEVAAQLERERLLHFAAATAQREREGGFQYSPVAEDTPLVSVASPIMVGADSALKGDKAFRTDNAFGGDDTSRADIALGASDAFGGENASRPTNAFGTGNVLGVGTMYGTGEGEIQPLSEIRPLPEVLLHTEIQPLREIQPQRSSHSEIQPLEEMQPVSEIQVVGEIVRERTGVTTAEKIGAGSERSSLHRSSLPPSPSGRSASLPPSPSVRSINLPATLPNLMQSSSTLAPTLAQNPSSSVPAIGAAVHSDVVVHAHSRGDLLPGINNHIQALIGEKILERGEGVEQKDKAAVMDRKQIADWEAGTKPIQVNQAFTTSLRNWIDPMPQLLDSSLAKGINALGGLSDTVAPTGVLELSPAPLPGTIELMAPHQTTASTDLSVLPPSGTMELPLTGLLNSPGSGSMPPQPSSLTHPSPASRSVPSNVSPGLTPSGLLIVDYPPPTRSSSHPPATWLGPSFKPPGPTVSTIRNSTGAHCTQGVHSNQYPAELAHTSSLPYRSLDDNLESVSTGGSGTIHTPTLSPFNLSTPSYSISAQHPPELIRSSTLPYRSVTAFDADYTLAGMRVSNIPAAPINPISPLSDPVYAAPPSHFNFNPSIRRATGGPYQDTGASSNWGHASANVPPTTTRRPPSIPSFSTNFPPDHPPNSDPPSYSIPHPTLNQSFQGMSSARKSLLLPTSSGSSAEMAPGVTSITSGSITSSQPSAAVAGSISSPTWTNSISSGYITQSVAPQLPQQPPPRQPHQPPPRQPHQPPLQQQGQQQWQQPARGQLLQQQPLGHQEQWQTPVTGMPLGGAQRPVARMLRLDSFRGHDHWEEHTGSTALDDMDIPSWYPTPSHGA